MAGINEELHLDIAGFVSNLNSAVSQATASINKLNAKSAAGARVNTAALSQTSAASAQASARAAKFNATVKRAGAAAAGVGAVSVALLVLGRRFPAIGVAAAKMWGKVSAGAKVGAGAVKSVAPLLARKVPLLLSVTTAVLGMVTAYKNLRFAAGRASSAVGKIKPPKVSGNSFLKGTGMVAAGGIIGQSIIAGVRRASAGIKGAIMAPISAAADDETLRVRFNVLVGDEGKAGNLLDELKQKAASTPLQFGDIAGATGKLLAFGESAETVTDVIGRVGDVSSGVGAPIGEIAEIYGKARVQGTLFAEDINQLTGRGIPVIQEFAKQMGVSEGEVKKLASQGKVTFPMLEKAFISLTGAGGRFEGMLSKQAQTFSGKISTLKDNVLELWRVFGAPITDALKPLLDVAIEKVQEVKDKAAEIGARVAAGINMIAAAIGVLMSMDLAQFAALLGDAIKVAMVAMVNLLWRHMVATFTAAGTLLQEAGKNFITLMGILHQGDFWSAMGTALLGVAQMFIAAIMNGVASFIEGMKKKLGPAGRKIFGDSDEKLRAKAEDLNISSKENMKEGGAGLLPYVDEITGRFKETATAVGDSYKDAFNNTEGVMEAPADSMERLRGFGDKIRAAMDRAKGDPEEGSSSAAGGDGTAAKAAAALPVTAGRLAGAISTLTGGTNGVVLQQEANGLLKKIAKNTEPKNGRPAPRRAAAAGTFT